MEREVSAHLAQAAAMHIGRSMLLRDHNTKHAGLQALRRDL